MRLAREEAPRGPPGRAPAESWENWRIQRAGLERNLQSLKDPGGFAAGGTLGPGFGSSCSRPGDGGVLPAARRGWLGRTPEACEAGRGIAARSPLPRPGGRTTAPPSSSTVPAVPASAMGDRPSRWCRAGVADLIVCASGTQPRDGGINLAYSRACHGARAHRLKSPPRGLALTDSRARHGGSRLPTHGPATGARAYRLKSPPRGPQRRGSRSPTHMPATGPTGRQEADFRTATYVGPAG